MTVIDLETARTQGLAPWDDADGEDQWVRQYRDRYPVTPGHRLFVPRRNDPQHIQEAFRQAQTWGQWLVLRGECTGYNIGFNHGRAAGQTVMYPHVHLIPRRDGDCADPTGGVRGVIPGQANYKTAGYQLPQ